MLSRLTARTALGVLSGLVFAGCARAPRQPNVLLITMDTTRADHIGCYAPHCGYTPTLDRLASQGWVFENARTVCPLTLPAHTSILTGVTPLRHGIRVNDGGALSAAIPTLPELFRTNGYATAAFVSAVVLSSRFGLDRGFDVYDDRLPPALYGSAAKADPAAAIVPPSIDGRVTTDRALAWLAGRKGPWFVWIHYYDPHAPYRERAGFEEHGVTNLYAQGVSYMDGQIGRLVDWLRQSGAYRNTWIVAIADHGESLGEHGEDTHGMTLYDATVRVPLIIKPSAPFATGVRREQRPVSGIDIAPTLAEAIGKTWPGANGPQGGRSLLAPPHASAPSREVYFETLEPEVAFGWAPLAGLAESEWKYIETPRAEIYDLVRDPAELDNRLARDDDVAERMKQNLGAWRQNIRTEQPAQTVMDSAMLERLRSLGYAAGGDAGIRAAATRPAVAGDTRRDVKDGLPLVREYHQTKGMVASGTWTSNDYRRAADLCEASPESPAFLLLLAGMAASAGNDAVAEQTYRKAIARSPENYEMTDAYGCFLLTRGAYEQAREQLLRSLETSGGISNQPLVAARLAHVELALGHAAAATNLLERILPLLPEKRALLKRLGDGRNLLGDPAGALVCYEQALREKANWIPVLEARAWTMACAGAAGERRRAMADAYILCLSTDNQEPRDLETMAVVYAANGKFEQAIATATRALDLIAGKIKAPGLADDTPADYLDERWKVLRDRTPFKRLIAERLERDLAAWKNRQEPTPATLRERVAARDYLLDDPARLKEPQ